MQKTNIPYITHSWNPLQDTRKGPSGRGYHCTKCSPGCHNCWAEGVNMRFGNKLPFDDTPAEFEIVRKELETPLRLKKRARIGTMFMGDLFHEDVRDLDVGSIFRVIEEAGQHTFIVLTKRPGRMSKYIRCYGAPKNVHLGVTACNQAEADEKTSVLSQIPAAVRFVSYEPLLTPVAIKSVYGHFPDWVIAGCESGPGRRPAKIEWFRDLKNQCVNAGVPFFLKQMTGFGDKANKVFHMPELDGKIWDQLPEAPE